MKTQYLPALLVGLLLCSGAMAEDSTASPDTPTSNATTGTGSNTGTSTTAAGSGTRAISCPSTGTGTSTTTGSTGSASTANSTSTAEHTDECHVTENETDEHDVQRVVDNLMGHDDQDQQHASVVRDPATGVMTVTLPDGRVFAVAPRGLTRHYGNGTGPARLRETGDGSMSLSSSTGDEVTLAAAPRNSSELAAEMARSGWRDTHTVSDHIETTTPAGSTLSVTPQMEIKAGAAATGTTSVVTDQQGDIQATYADGSLQTFAGYPHDWNDLRAQAMSIGASNITLNTDGTLTVTLAGTSYRFRMDSEVRQGQNQSPGIRTESGRIVVDYRDGMQQTIEEVH
jgi:hypothetical protein